MGVDAVGKVYCAGEVSQGPLLEMQRELEQKLKDNVGEMLRQRNYAIELHERVESLLEGDVCNTARPKGNKDAMACSWALVPCVVPMRSGTGIPGASVWIRGHGNRDELILVSFLYISCRSD